MKQLLLLRHAKSDWDADYDSDADRPLSTRGIKAAGTMGRVLTAARSVPDVVISSSAQRARTTAQLAIEAGGWTADVRITEALYMPSIAGVLHEVHHVEDSVGRLMLVGHEPSWSALAGILTGGSRIQVKTATVVAIDFAIDTWRHVHAGRGEIAWVLAARLFTDGDFGF